jgi:hypothetical protein
LRVSVSASPSSSASTASVVLLRVPLGFPAGFPLFPGLKGICGVASVLHFQWPLRGCTGNFFRPAVWGRSFSGGYRKFGGRSKAIKPLRFWSWVPALLGIRLYDSRVYKKILRELFAEGERPHLKKRKIDIIIHATDIGNGSYKLYTGANNEDWLDDALFSSSAIPFLFQTFRRGGNFIDGGIINNFPSEQLLPLPPTSTHRTASPRGSTNAANATPTPGSAHRRCSRTGRRGPSALATSSATPRPSATASTAATASSTGSNQAPSAPAIEACA